MRRRNGAGCLLAALLTFTGACESPVETGDPPTISLSIVSGSGQTGAVGTELSGPLVVRVTTERNKKTVGLPDQLVNFRIVTGEGSVFAGSALTDLRGMAREYWTLGPEIGENVLEVRSVDPSTGEKQVFARFNAFGVIPGPEVCNGLDDNLDGTPDDPTWRYCEGGAAAANTNGMNTCSDDYVDLNAVASDGCERLLGGRWTITPTVTLSCPGLAPLAALGLPSSVSVSEFTVTASEGELGLGATVNFGAATVTSDNFIPLALVPTGESFAGSGPFEFDLDLPLASNAAGSGTLELSGAFTGAGSFEATLKMTLDLTMTVPLLGQLRGDCGDVDVPVTATRVGS